MLTPKLSSLYIGLSKINFANPLYLKQAQKEKPCLYNVKYDKNDLANLFAPKSDETLRLTEESRSKLCKNMYVQSLEKEIDELQTNEFSKEYDLLLQECILKDIMCSILCALVDLDEQTDLQGLTHRISVSRPHLRSTHMKDKGNDLIMGNHGFDLYKISLQEISSPTTICFMAKASPTQAWLWHRRLSYLNFDTINLISKKDIVNGLPKLKYVKDQPCSSCELGKAKRSSFKTKTILSSKGRLNLLHIDLCGPKRIESINEKKYILVIVDDYS
ncbi:retrovirus-related pol polyprotein from transposon TNT 1-94 [Tanacetum coccineum]